MKHIQGEFQKNDAITLPVNETVFALFGEDFPVSVYCFDSSHVSRVKRSTHVVSMVINLCKYSGLLLRNIAKHWIDTSSRSSFCFVVRKHGNHFAHSFFVSNFQSIYDVQNFLNYLQCLLDRVFS